MKTRSYYLVKSPASLAFVRDVARRATRVVAHRHRDVARGGVLVEPGLGLVVHDRSVQGARAASTA